MALGAAATLIGTGAEPQKCAQQQALKSKGRRMQQPRSMRKQQEAARGSASNCFGSLEAGQNHLFFMGNKAYPCLLGRVRTSVSSSSEGPPAPCNVVHLGQSSSDSERCEGTGSQPDPNNRSGEMANFAAPLSEPWESHHTTPQDQVQDQPANFLGTDFSNCLSDLPGLCNPPQACELPPTLLLEPMKVELSKPGKPAAITPVSSPSHHAATPGNPQYLNSFILEKPVSPMHHSLLASCHPRTPPAAQAIASRAPPGLSLTQSSRNAPLQKQVTVPRPAPRLKLQDVPQSLHFCPSQSKFELQHSGIDIESRAMEAGVSSDCSPTQNNCQDRRVNGTFYPSNHVSELPRCSSEIGGGAAGAGVSSDCSPSQMSSSGRGGGGRDRRFTCKFIFGGFDVDRDADFELVPRLIGRGGVNMRNIARACDGKVRIRGRGSGHQEQQKGSRVLVEADVPLQIALSCKDSACYEEGRRQVFALLDFIAIHFERYCRRKGVLPVPPLFSVAGDEVA
jgi:hypothetical protein